MYLPPLLISQTETEIGQVQQEIQRLQSALDDKTPPMMVCVCVCVCVCVPVYVCECVSGAAEQVRQTRQVLDQ